MERNSIYDIKSVEDLKKVFKTFKEAKENGLYENFGQSYARAIENEFRYSKGKDYQSQMEVVYAVQQFANRMANLSLAELQYI